MDHKFFKISDTVDLKLAYSGGIRNAVLFFHGYIKICIEYFYGQHSLDLMFKHCLRRCYLLLHRPFDDLVGWGNI